MKKRKQLVSLIAVLVALSLCACNTNLTSTTTGNSNSTTNATEEGIQNEKNDSEEQSRTETDENDISYNDYNQATLERIEKAKMTGTPSVIVSEEYVKSGENTVVKLILVNNPGILGMTMTMYYDESLIELLSIKNGKAFQGVLDLESPDKLESGCSILWVGTDIEDDQVHDGEILCLDVKALDDLKPSKTPITIVFDVNGVLDQNLSVIDTDVKNGYINISN